MELPEKIRVSVGTANKLGLKKIKMNVQTTNCHLLTYHSEGCDANCAFCPQSQYTFNILENLPDSQKFLSRVTWPDYQLKKVLDILKSKFFAFSLENNGFQRICLQSLNYSGFLTDVLEILRGIKDSTKIPISVTLPSIPVASIIDIKQAGAERICFALDSPNKDVFEKTKGIQNSGPYLWEEHINLLKESVAVFGKNFVSTHLIIGLGETEIDSLKFISDMKNIGIKTGLFSFFPIKHTKFEGRKRASIEKFRKMQLGKYLIDSNKSVPSDFTFNKIGDLESFNISEENLRDIVDIGGPFQTSGCPGCNRPYYTSTPHEEQYNFPRKLTENEKEIVYHELQGFI